MKQGIKHDEEKPRWSLLPWRAVGQVVEVLTYGAKKYSPDNWKSVEHPQDRYFSAAQRHLTDWWEGETRDPESGKLHLAHAACCLLFLIWFELREGAPAKRYRGPIPQPCTCGSIPAVEQKAHGNGTECFRVFCTMIDTCKDGCPATLWNTSQEGAVIQWNYVIDERRKLK